MSARRVSTICEGVLVLLLISGLSRCPSFNYVCSIQHEKSPVICLFSKQKQHSLRRIMSLRQPLTFTLRAYGTSTVIVMVVLPYNTDQFFDYLINLLIKFLIQWLQRLFSSYCETMGLSAQCRKCNASMCLNKHVLE